MTRLLLFALLLPAAVQAQEVTVSHTGAAAVLMDAARLAALPAMEASIEGGNPPVKHVFTGPLIWTVLVAAHAVDPARHGDAVGQTLSIVGADHYVAIVAAGELSPEFEGKPAILALRMDGATLPRPRAIIPGDHRMGRSVRDVVRLRLEDLPKVTP